MSITPLITAEDRQRGFSEFEIQFPDGRSESVRVHALKPSDLLRLVALSPTDALREGLMKSLRADAEFVAGIDAAQQLAIMTVQAYLSLGDDAGRAGVGLSIAAVKAQQLSAHPQTGNAMRAGLASLAANAQAFKAVLHGLTESSKVPHLPKL